jgi:hypothetical protein
MRWHRLTIIALFIGMGMVALVMPPLAPARAKVVHVPGGGRLVVPKGSLTAGARIVAGHRTRHGRAGRGVSLRVVHGHLKGPITLSLPFRGHAPHVALPSDLLVQLAYYDTRARRWRSVPGRFDSRTRMVTAVIRHLSIWDPRTWDWRGFALQMDQAVGKLRSARADAPQCDHRRALPRWFDPSVSDEAGLPLRTCAEVWDDRRAVVKIVNNRPYGRMMRLVTPVAAANHTMPDGLVDLLGAQLGDAMATKNEIYLPPLKEAQIAFSPIDGWQFGDFRGLVDYRTVADDLITFVLTSLSEDVQKSFTKDVLGKLVASCSWMFKVKADGTVGIDTNVMDSVGKVAGCLASAAPNLAANGALDGWKVDQIEKRLSMLANLNRVADLASLAAKLGDLYFGWQQDGANASFGVALGNKPTAVLPAPGGTASPSPVVTDPPLQSSTPPVTPAVDRTAITSYDRMAPGAPHHGYFDVVWQAFTAQSNTITSVGVTVGTPGLTAGVAVPYDVTVRLCSQQPDGGGGCPGQLAEARPQIVNYGDTEADIGDVGVSKGATYWVEWLQPSPAAGNSWVTYWWAGGSGIADSDQMQMVVKGYDR